MKFLVLLGAITILLGLAFSQTHSKRKSKQQVKMSAPTKNQCGVLNIEQFIGVIKTRVNGSYPPFSDYLRLVNECELSFDLNTENENRIREALPFLKEDKLKILFNAIRFPYYVRNQDVKCEKPGAPCFVARLSGKKRNYILLQSIDEVRENKASILVPEGAKFFNVSIGYWPEAYLKGTKECYSNAQNEIKGKALLTIRTPGVQEPLWPSGRVSSNFPELNGGTVRIPIREGTTIIELCLEHKEHARGLRHCNDVAWVNAYFEGHR